MNFSNRQRGWIVGFVAVPVAALSLSACVPPKPAPAPAPTSAAAQSQSAPASVEASATGDADRENWGADGDDVGDKTRVTTTTAPPAPSCNGATHQIAIEQCHLTYRSYLIDNTSNAAQATAEFIAHRITTTECSNGTLALYHSGSSKNPGQNVLQKYPGAASASENLYCLYFTPPGCAGIAFGATSAKNGWLASPGHKANMDSILSRTVNGGGACFTSFGGGNSVYVAVAHFHNP